MFSKPLVLGIDAESVRTRFGLPLGDALQDLGNNTGNMMFSEALYAIIRDGRRASYHFAEAEITECDVVVVAAANWINPSSDFGELASRLEKYKRPVVLCGLGAQTGLEKQIPSVKEGTMRLIRLASSTSAAISTRGDFTAEVLNSFGIKNVVSTGCPSLMLAGPRGPSLRHTANATAATTVIHSTRHLFNTPHPFHGWLYAEAMRLGSDLLLQSELADMYYALGITADRTILDRAAPILSRAYGGAAINTVSAYLRRHGKVPITLTEWLGYLKSKNFALGTRFHGTIAAILAGTPALLIVHDARTAEMAAKMNIPSLDWRAIDPEAKLDLADLHARADFSSLVPGYSDYYRNFLQFFETNGLRISKAYGPGSTECAAH